MRWEMLNCVKQGGKWIVLFPGWYWLTHTHKKRCSQTIQSVVFWDGFFWPLQLLHFSWTPLKLNEDPPKPFSINIVDQKPCLSAYWFSFCKELCNEFTWVTWLPMVGGTLNYIVSFSFWFKFLKCNSQELISLLESFSMHVLSQQGVVNSQSQKYILILFVSNLEKAYFATM